MKTFRGATILLLAAVVAANVAAADERQSSLLVETTSWTDDVTMASERSPATSEASLESRVAALEQALRAQNVSAASAQETLPAAEKAAESCKQVEIITKPTYEWRGRLFVDGVSYDDDDDTTAFFGVDRDNDFGFGTARFGVEGDIFENINYVFELEFEGTEVDFKDVYIEMHSLPGLGHFRAGHFKEPIGLEELTSSRFITFMERSYATTTFTPARKFGVMAFNAIDDCDDATWFLGAFRDSDDSPNGIATQRDDRNDWSLDSRFVWLPYYDEPSEGRYLVHLGASYSYRNKAEDAEFQSNSYVSNQGPVGVGALADSDDYNQLGAEFLVIWGALSFQSEYFHAFLSSGEQYHGAYAHVSYFLTGEHRGYEKEDKAIYRVHPFEPAFWVDTCGGFCCGRGAWELTAGYSYVDLEDGADITTGTAERAFVDGFIVGMNWYLNPYSRMMFNYNHEMTNFVDAATPDSNANLFGVRWQIDF
ncbi:MAG: porin [Pirellulales bacterium]